MIPYTLHRGTAPLLVSLPHNGSVIPDDIAARMTPRATRSVDTDWHVAELYDFAREMGASVLRPFASRYVVDVNRPADGHALYPGRKETGLVPTMMFNGDDIYLEGKEPDAAEIAARVDRWWRPYHDAIGVELDRLKALHGHVVLWEGHSIRSHVPMLFDGKLPDFNLGTADSTSCVPELQSRLEQVLARQSDYSYAVNGRFKGGYITREYGRPDDGVSTVQLELAQVNYMDEDSFAYLPEKAAGVQMLIGDMLKLCLEHSQVIAS
ncbi:N-formylglutamate deformylase [Luteibacter rhizovicinus]|uniref:N-formylglutamate deformylase n=1 Tax=Luteibacter rhizovicinus TaxID=242606 RepID=A0A4R3Z0B7_9GAMM|nr:N-formylglutamate deformylase [Luteibacter rhizovicinus]TCV97123.1 N-formylglutamate deformylase [Luteibacter rhizovicinus]